jgi:hypothetical protein
MGRVQEVSIREGQGNLPESQESGGESVNSSIRDPFPLKRRARIEGYLERETRTKTPSRITIPAPMLPESGAPEPTTGKK